MTVKNSPVRHRAIVSVRAMPAQNRPVIVMSVDGCSGMSSVSGFGCVAGFPLDAASCAWLLCDGDTVAGQHRTDGRPQRCPINRLVVAGPAVVELTAVDEVPFLVEEEEIRCACCTICLGNLLGFVVAEGKGERERFGHCLQSFGGVIRVGVCVVAADGNHPYAFRDVVFSELRERYADVNDIGTVVADEHDEEPGLPRNIIQRHDAPRDHVSQRKRRGWRSKRKHCGICQSHAVFV